MSAPQPDPRLTAARERLLDLRRRGGSSSDSPLLDEALTLLGELSRSQSPPSHERPTFADLADVNKQLRTLLDNTLVGIYKTTRDGRVLYANETLSQILGFPSVEAFIAMSARSTYMAPADRDGFIAALEAAGGRLVNYELTHRTPAGDLKCLLTSANLEGDILTGVVVDITDRKQAEEALHKHARELEAVSAVAEEITRELDPHQLLDLITRRAIELVQANSGGLHFWSESEQVLTPQVTAGVALAPWQAGIRYRLGEGAVGSVAQRREGLIINDYRAWAGALPVFLQHTDIAAVLAEPLLYQGGLLGVLALTRSVGRPFTEDDRHLLRLFASQAAVAITNARLFQEEQRRREQMEALRHVGSEITRELDLDRLLTAILERAMTLVGTRSGMILLWDEARQVLIPRVLLGELATMPQSPIPLGEGIVGRVAQGRHGLIVNDYLHWPGARQAVLAHTIAAAGLAEPLLYRDTLVGVINLARTANQAIFSEQDSQLLRLFADQAVIAIENARLFQEERQRREQMETIRLVSGEITRELDLDRLLDLILRRAIQLAEAEAGVILMWDEEKQELFPRVRTEEFFHDMPKRSIPLGEGVVGRVAATRTGLIVNDYRTWAGARPQALVHTAIAASLAEPLLYRDRLIGVINLSNTAEQGGFGQQHGILLRLFADQAAIAIENARLFQEERQRREQLEAVRLISAEITRELDLDRLLDLILRRAAELVGAPAGFLSLWDELRQQLLPHVRFGDSIRQMPPRSIPLGEGLMGRVAASRQGLIVNDYRTWAGARPEALASAPITASFGEPLLYRDRLIGVINLVHLDGSGTFTEQHGALLRLFADQAAIAIENARLYQALDQSFQDLQRAQDELLHSQKLRALGQLAAGIAHDLNNMLAAVLGQIELLKLRVAYPEVREALATLETAATDGAEIVRRIQDFARQRADTPLNPCHLPALVGEAIEITRPRWKDEAERQGVTIGIHAALEDLPAILGNPAEIRQALTNLLFNAVDAMPQGGTIGIAGTATADMVLLTIRDTGVGMPETVRSRVFEPFFSTKGVRGTGLGLSVVYGTLERHGGRIDVASRLGEGSTFTLQFQRAQTEGEVGRPAPAANLPPSHRILLVDDDPRVRHTMATLLTAVGQQVVEAEGGASALALLVDGRFDLVFTDLGMPDMTGWQVAEAVKERHPSLPVVLITGWQDQVTADEKQRRFVDAILPKPSRLEDLLRVIRELGASSSR